MLRKLSQYVKDQGHMVMRNVSQLHIATDVLLALDCMSVGLRMFLHHV